MISLRIYQVINVKSSIDSYRLTTIHVIERVASDMFITSARDGD